MSEAPVIIFILIIFLTWWILSALIEYNEYKRYCRKNYILPMSFIKYIFKEDIK